MGDGAVLFPFAEYWWAYAAFTLGVLGLLALDLGVFHRRAHAVSFREASIWSVVWITLALGFNYGFYRYAAASFGPDAGARLGLEFLTGYIVEKSLAVDNIFVFVMVFQYFAVPPRYQHRVLFFGIIGALLFRALFIAAGSILMQYWWLVVLFGAFLIFTGVKMMLVPDRNLDPGNTALMRLFRRVVPISPHTDGERFLTRIDGRRMATPLLVALAFVEMSDIVFAIDSVPAIFAVTREPLIVFTSNVMAILGLRSMYFLLSGAVERFALLKYGLALVLVFVGLKMVWLNDAFGGKFPITWSLAIIAGILGTSIIVSLWSTRGRRTVPPGPAASRLADPGQGVGQ
jgi:tellurite resistance protein TerC